MGPWVRLFFSNRLRIGPTLGDHCFGHEDSSRSQLRRRPGSWRGHLGKGQRIETETVFTEENPLPSGKLT